MALQINATAINHVRQKMSELWKVKSGIYAKDFVKIYPFRLIAGAQLTTNTGFKGLNSYINDYNDLALIFTGQESITAEWRNSIKIEQIKDDNDPSNPDKNYIKKTKKTGLFFEGRISNHFQNQQVSVYAPNTDFQKLIVARTFSAIFEFNRSKYQTREINNDIITNFIEYEFDFFVCPTIALQKIKDQPNNNFKNSTYFPVSNSKIDWNHQLFRPLSVDYYYDGQNRIIAVEIKFVSVNDFMSNSGLAIQQYIGFGSGGEGYSFPIENNDGSVSVDQNLVQNLGVTHAQFDIFGPAMINNIVLFGYENIEEQDDDGNYYTKIFAPSEIYLTDQFQSPIYDYTKQKSLSETNFYYAANVVPDIVSQYKNWQELIAAKEYNPFFKKSYEGYFNFTIDPKYSNQLQNGKYLYEIGNPEFVNKIYNGTNFIDNVRDWSKYTGLFSNNIYFGANSKGINDFNFYTNVKYNSLANAFMQNHLLYSNIHQIPVNLESSIAVSASLNLGIGGIIGKFVPFAGFFSSFLNQNIPLGFRISTNRPNSDYSGYDFLLSAPVFDLAKSLVAGNYIPMDYFRFGTNDGILALGGQNTTTTSFLSTLTNEVEMFGYDENNNVDGNPIIKQTFWNGQSDGIKTYFYTPNSQLKRTTVKNFIITGFVIKAIAKTDFRVSFIHAPNDDPTKEIEINYNDFIWNGYYKTKSNFSNNSFLWESKQLIGNPFFDLEQNFKFPVDLNNHVKNRISVIPKEDYSFEAANGSENNLAYNASEDPQNNNALAIRQFKSNPAPILKNVDIFFDQTSLYPEAQISRLKYIIIDLNNFGFDQIGYNQKIYFKATIPTVYSENKYILQNLNIGGKKLILTPNDDLEVFTISAELFPNWTPPGQKIWLLPMEISFKIDFNQKKMNIQYRCDWDFSEGFPGVIFPDLPFNEFAKAEFIPIISNRNLLNQKTPIIFEYEW